MLKNIQSIILLLSEILQTRYELAQLEFAVVRNNLRILVIWGFLLLVSSISLLIFFAIYVAFFLQTIFSTQQILIALSLSCLLLVIISVYIIYSVLKAKTFWFKHTRIEAQKDYEILLDIIK